MTRAEVSTLLDYDPARGVFRWKEWRGGTAWAGTIAGRPDSRGGRQIKIDGRAHMAGRLAWLLVHGRWPAGTTIV